MAEEKNISEESAAPKKKLSVVFRTQNSAQNSLKTRTGAAKPVKKVVKKKVVKKIVKKAPEAEAAKEVTAPDLAAAEEAPTTKKVVKKVVKKAETKAETKAAAEAPEVEKPAEEKPKKTAPKTTKKAEEEAPAKPKETPRFVDMDAVRAAGRPQKKPARGRNVVGNAGDGRVRKGNGRPSQNAAQGDRDRAPRGAAKPQGGFKGGAPSRPGPQLNAYELAMQKPGKGGKGGRQNKKYDAKRNSDGLRRPSNAKISNKYLVRTQKKQEPEEPQIKLITIPEVLTIKELAQAMKIQPATIIKKLFMQGKIVTVNDEIDYEEAENIAVEFEVLCEKEIPVDVIAELLEDKTEEREEDLESRPPVVCVMGHVDHGKTSLLDAIRETNVISKEAGGITQAIGAYMVEVNGRQITFLDTPGHEAFTAMRMRGAQATDIAILVVAADDGVMPQTIEAINHAKAAGVEIIVAINKIDKPGADINKVKQELTEYQLVDSEWGGETTMVPISAKKGEGITELLEMVLLQADVLELKASAKRNARGLVIEAQLDKGRGPVATVLVQKGTLKVGDTVAAGSSFGKIRAMVNDKGERVKEATPSTPVEILGLNDVPNAGEVFVSTDSEKDARSFAETFIAEEKKKLVKESKHKVTLDALFDQIKEGELKDLNIIVKADVQGSVEAVKNSLSKLSNEEVVVKVIHSGAGNINESDVTLASASNAIIIGFNVKIDATAKASAESEKVDVRMYDIIYKAIEDVEAAMKGMLAPVFEEKVVGHAEVRQLFKSSKAGVIAGSYVLDGKITRGCSCRITRDGEQIFDGKIATIQRFKDEVKEVKEGFECGLVFEGFNDLQEEDKVEAYEMVEVPRN